ncbi:MAG: hypothetical protein MAG453_00179 [Calditrichaeota bacterium]|nr:hypothetical protein [Calditrichota bacterium]
MLNRQSRLLVAAVLIPACFALFAGCDSKSDAEKVAESEQREILENYHRHLDEADSLLAEAEAQGGEIDDSLLQQIQAWRDSFEEFRLFSLNRYEELERRYAEDRSEQGARLDAKRDSLNQRWDFIKPRVESFFLDDEPPADTETELGS